MVFYVCGIILILSVKEAVDSLRLHGGVPVASNDGGAKALLVPRHNPAGFR